MIIDKLFLYKRGNYYFINNNYNNNNEYYTFHYYIFDIEKDDINNYDTIYIKNNENNCIIYKNNIIENYDYKIYSPKIKNNNFIPINILKLNNDENYKLDKLHSIKEWNVVDTIYIYKDYLVDNNIQIHKNNVINNEPYISIVMVHYNRLPQLEYTLKTIDKTLFKNIEVIIVDDASDRNFFDSLKNMINNYNFKISLVDITYSYKKMKNYKNPVIPFNIGFNLVKDNITIIQNAECCHIKDLITYVNNNLKELDYMTFSCFSLSKKNTKKIYNNINLYSYIKSQKINKRERNYWFNHIKEQPSYYHFTSAIHIKYLKNIGGFHEGLCNDIAYDDDEFLYRIKKQNMKINIVPFNENTPFVIHQYHDIVYNVKNYTAYNGQLNKLIFNSIKSHGVNFDYNKYKYL